MANDFTTLVPKIFGATLPSLRQAARAVRVCRVDFDAQVAQKGNVIDMPVPVQSSTTDVSPGVSPAANTDKTPLTKQIALSNWKRSDKFTLTGKQAREFDAGNFRGSQFTEQTIAVIELMNSDVLVGMKNAAYKSTGTAATTPFGAGVLQLSSINVRKVLNTMKAPYMDRHLMLDPAAEAAALNVPAISDASLRGNGGSKQSGEIGEVFGLNHWGDQQIPTQTMGTAAGALTHGTTIGAVGSSSVYLKAATPGTLKKGDLIHITTGGVVYDYSVQADVASVDTTAAGIAVTVSPPVQVTHVAGDTWTLTATHVANIGLQRGAYGLAIRPLDPAELGLGTHITMTDPETGLAITYSQIPEYMQMSYQVSVLYGHGPLRNEWLCRLLG